MRPLGLSVLIPFIEEIFIFFTGEYFIHEEGRTYVEAVQSCKSWGGRLFEPKTPQANAEVFKLAKAQGISTYWLGIHDVNNEGNFVYDSDGKAIGWTNWRSGEPNDFNQQEDCVMVSAPRAEAGKWNDFCCNSNCVRAFVCEK